MSIPTAHLRDMVDIYDAPSMTTEGVYTGGTTVVAGSCRVAILPLTTELTMMLGGGFERTRVRVLAEPTLDMQTNAKIVVLASVVFAGGTLLQVEGDPQVFPDPFNTGAAHHKEVIAVVER